MPFTKHPHQSLTLHFILFKYSYSFFLILLLSSLSLSLSLSLTHTHTHTHTFSISHKRSLSSLLSTLSSLSPVSHFPLGLHLILSWVWVWVMGFLLKVWFWIGFFVDFGLISFDFWLIFCCCYGFRWWLEFVFAYRWCWVLWERMSDESRRGEKKNIKILE